ncbi:leucine-rich repeat domain-containing protein [Odoribacter sp. OttesenSCG-928-J03]|nr:leucine-rich repeat domain-containing protein [Odoribacter sp. OttesenSCG-928-J03]MDL2282911.1 leucine-rich repeat domain-containing protein [Odoribacter sp. OttesenSCG-928-G04]MDL2330877.1 leucine-rich repeat domain-containing protein [Odoribacter sp. OttesenSCG-928-A06]
MKQILFIFTIIILFFTGCSEDEQKEIATLAEVKTIQGATEISPSSAKIGGKIIHDGHTEIIAKGICWSERNTPTILNARTVNTDDDIVYTDKLTPLEPGKTYCARAYATNTVGTAYGESVYFTTFTGIVTLSSQMTVINTSTIIVENVISDTGGMHVVSKGVCWSTSKQPTVEDNITEDGKYAEKYSSEISNLLPGMIYHLRAYVTTSYGNTFYGNEIEYVSQPELLEITPGTLEQTLIERNQENVFSLKLGGEIDQRDFAYMNKLLQTGNLVHIDLGEVNIVAYGSYPANGIPARAFAFGLPHYSVTEENTKLNSFVFPKNITSIGKDAFNNCTQLKGELTLPVDIKKIEAGTFNNCRSLSGSLIIPQEVTSIGESAFSGCGELDGTLTIGENVKSIGVRAFYKCWGLSGPLTIPSSVKDIGDFAFEGCNGFRGALTLGDSIRYIGGYAFYGCLGFTGPLNIPNEVKVVHHDAFGMCSGFNGTLTLGEKLETIGREAFAYCGKLDSLVINDSIKEIKDGAFHACFGISGTIEIPLKTEYIGENAFYTCTSLKRIKVAWETPIQYTKNMFYSGIPISVPHSAVERYQSSTGWEDHSITGY